jgi:hypothetical protein
MLASFLNAGGLDAALQMMTASACPRALAYTASLIETLMIDIKRHGAQDIQDHHVGDKFFEAGACIHEAFCKGKNPNVTLITLHLSSQ